MTSTERIVEAHVTSRGYSIVEGKRGSYRVRLWKKSKTKRSRKSRRASNPGSASPADAAFNERRSKPFRTIAEARSLARKHLGPLRKTQNPSDVVAVANDIEQVGYRDGQRTANAQKRIPADATLIRIGKEKIDELVRGKGVRFGPGDKSFAAAFYAKGYGAGYYGKQAPSGGVATLAGRASRRNPGKIGHTPLSVLKKRYAREISLSNGDAGVAGMGLQSRASDLYREGRRDEAEALYRDAMDLQRYEGLAPPLEENPRNPAALNPSMSPDEVMSAMRSLGIDDAEKGNRKRTKAATMKALTRAGLRSRADKERAWELYVDNYQFTKTHRRRNPSPATRHGASSAEAADLYESFHGKPSTQVTEVHTPYRYRTDLSELGELRSLKVLLMTGDKEEITFPEGGPNAVWLCSSPNGAQLYFEGGVQKLNLNRLGMGSDKWFRDLMVLGVLYEVTYRTEKGFDKFELTDYYHELGEETGQQPLLIYDTLNDQLSVAGGQYEVKPEGIVN